jgi:cytochrome P450
MSLQELELTARKAWSVAAEVPAPTVLAYGFFMVAAYLIARSIYLLALHPLARFPGPKVAAVSDIWYAYHWLTGRYPWAIEAVVKKYGDVVRIAPNELVFMTPAAFGDIHGTVVRGCEVFIKTKFQDVDTPEPGLTAERDPERHKRLRKQILPAFGGKALHGMELLLYRHVDGFIAQLKEHGTKAEKGIEITKWIDWLTWDFAGDVGYSCEFDQVKNMKYSINLSSFLDLAPWGTINQISRRFPLIRPLIWFIIPSKIARTLSVALKYNREEVRRRVRDRKALQHGDYFERLVPTDGLVPSEEWLLATANVFISAGYDTMANHLAALLYFLCVNEEKYKRITEEIWGAFTDYSQITLEQLQTLPYLQAVIDETLRCHNNCSFGMPRVSPGATVDGTFVPKGVVVQTCNFARMHSEKYFKNARKYQPERHLPKSHPLYDPEYSGDVKEAFNPFSQGPRGCPGVAITYMEAKIFLARFLWTFDIELINKKEIDWERDIRVFTIWVRPEMYVKLSCRQMATSSEGNRHNV